MPTSYNDVFRLISLRGTDPDVAVDPEVEPEEGGDDDGDGPIVELVRSGALHLGALRPQQADELVRSHSALVEEAMSSELNSLARTLARAPDAQPASEVEWDGAAATLDEVARSPSFRRQHRMALNAWLLLKFAGREIYESLETQLRVAAWLQALAGRGGSSAPPLREMLERPMTVPRSLRASITAARMKRRPPRHSIAQSRLSASYSEPNDYANAEGEIAALSTIAEGIADAVLTHEVEESSTSPPVTITGRLRRGLLDAFRDLLIGRTPEAEPEPESPPAVLTLDAAVASDVRARLGESAAQLFDDVLAGLPEQPAIDRVFDTLSSRRFEAIDQANTRFETVWRDRYQVALPPAVQAPLPTEDGAVQALGWGDLIVASERLVDYEAREIAHIENVLPNERKNRQHERRQTIEDVLEVETEESEESERELETTDRHELQTETSSVIAEEFSIQAGVNTSGRYGLTKVETSLDAGFTRSSAEARRSTLNVAKEIVSRAVDRTFRRVRELRRRTTTTEIIETNQHEINNIPAEGTADAISGIYRWVEKIHEVELRHYGTRMMIEFSVPEPALSVLGLDVPPDVGVEPPDPLTIDASDITEGNYLSLARAYEAVGVAPPPDLFIDVGFTWASQPEEKTDENTAEDVISQLVAIPENYRPIGGAVTVSGHPAEAQFFQVRFQVGDRRIAVNGVASFRRAFSLSGSYTWPGGVPVSMTAHGHFDKTLSLNVVFLCVRRKEALEKWKIDTFEKILAGYQRKLAEYNEAVSQARLDDQIAARIEGQPEAVNRRTEREELQKWSIKILRREPFDLDAVVTEGAGEEEHDEIDPVRADRQAPLVRFYQEAFEWDNMSYFFYPYFWGRRRAWTFRQSLRHNDYRFETFLRAGSARVIVPVTPGYEERILYYLANPDLEELDRIRGPEDLLETSEVPPSIEESVYSTLWLELLLDRNEQLALGSGFLSVTNGSEAVTVVDSLWEPGPRDIGRELYIDGGRYEIGELSGPDGFLLTEPFAGTTNPRAPYATGSVPFGQPWVVNLPTTLVILDENRAGLSA